MSSEEIRPPGPTAVSSLYATNYDEAERALPDPQLATWRASLRSSCSNGAYAAETLRGTISYTGYFTFPTPLSGSTDFLERSREIIFQIPQRPHYDLYITSIEENFDTLRI
jgi:hypothetical protein